ncbi:MAG: hypothetical protein KFW09_05685 [Oscillospiraceae bacterium]|nr:hypothetical protein [Oscillospiraceae bacterium]
MKKMHQFRLTYETHNYIENFAKENNIAKTKSLEKIVKKHSQIEGDMRTNFVKLLAKEVGIEIKKDLTRIRLGTNTADKNSQIIIELLQGIDAHHDIQECITTDLIKVKGIEQAEATVKKRIEGYRQRNLEKNSR